MILFYVVFAL